MYSFKNGKISVFVYLLILSKFVTAGVINNRVENDCDLPETLLEEIASYGPTVISIIESATKGNLKGFTYNELAKFVDKFGNRKTGTENLEHAIDYMMDISKARKLDNVRGEEVVVPNWIRGQEYASLVKPRQQKLHILGLGYSVGTPPDGILAEALVVKSFDDLKKRANEAKGKIVVYNEDWVSYGVTVQYRSRGASEAAKVGAVASLIRSATGFSMNTPHTGMQDYQANVTQIPTACISAEDAHMLQRMQDRGEDIRIYLNMEAKLLPNEISRNTIVDLKGTTYPEKVVIVSGHIDSWDVGQGAMDDGGGVFISYASLVLLKQLGLRPKRTIRAIFWTAEEFGMMGAQAYEKAHRNESDNFNFFMESDIGTFNPLGIEYAAGKKGGCILEEVMKLLEPISTTQARNSSDVGSDITLWTSAGFPGASLLNANEKYFWFHHSEGDTMDVEDPDALDKSTALWASVAYVLADLSIDFPRN